ncbi:MAG: type II toxin-antitoxin system HipA family toxin [Candidatus Pacearchaeota archaeon]|nr:type II toxin-antitoxin system HipA family toxin [Candidatus Pacearchaeota archaeon]
MKINTDQRIRQINIKVAGEVAGLLEKNAQFEFTYHSDAQFPVAVAMPIEKRFYQHGALFPIFEMNIPEGFIRHRIVEKLRKHIQVDDMLFLALQGNTGIGCLSYETQGIEQEEVNAVDLAEILAWKGGNELFEDLVNRYLLQSSISGIQPKVMVPEASNNVEKGAVILPSLIVKSGDEEFPQLAINEYICMQLARACQIETPEFWLSDNQELFVMRRFDLKSDGTCLAMEDMAVLQGKSTNDKYQSSYESVSKVIDIYSSEPKTDNEILFKMLVHSCMVGNGDAHLKNYAMLYDDPDNMRLSPLYDVVNTQVYTPADTLALGLTKSKDFPDRRRIVDFGKSIGVKKCDDIVDEMADKIRDELNELANYTDAMESDIKSSILENIHRTTTRTAIKARPKRRHSKYP